MSPVQTMTESLPCGVNSAPVGVWIIVAPFISNWVRCARVCRVPLLSNKRDVSRLPIRKQNSLVEIGPERERSGQNLGLVGGMSLLAHPQLLGTTLPRARAAAAR